MRRIRMTTTLSGERDVFLKDKECDLEDAEAESFIAAGIAVAVGEPAAPAAPAAPPVRGPGRPRKDAAAE